MSEDHPVVLAPQLVGTAHECPKCTWVADKSFIRRTPEQQEAATMSPGKYLKAAFRLAHREDFVVALGLFTLPGWSGHNMWYLFECPDCQELSHDYLHGHRLYLVCDNCDARWQVQQGRFYEDSGLPKPPTFWQQLRMLREMQRRLNAEPKVRIHRDRLP